MDNHSTDGAAKCPFTGATTLSSKQGSAGTGPVNRDWWPNQLKLNILRQHSASLILWSRLSIMFLSLSLWI